MAHYKDRIGYGSASSVPSHLPYLNTTVPPVGTEVALVYNNRGDYMGWSDEATIKKKYLYGSLYYKTKGAYSITTSSKTNDKHVWVREKQSSKTALTIVYRKLGKLDVVDKSSTSDLTNALIDAVNTADVNPYNYSYVLADVDINKTLEPILAAVVPEFDVKLTDLRRQAAMIEKQIQNLFKVDMKNQVIDYLKAKNTAGKELDAAKDETGLDLDL